MNRRSLLRGLFAAPAIVAASSLMPIKVMAALAPLPPHLYGDGIHDDTAALQWIIDNHKGPGLVMPSGHYRVSAPIKFVERDGVVWSNTKIVNDGAHEALIFDRVHNCTVRDFTIQQREYVPSRCAVVVTPADFDPSAWRTV